MTAAALAETYAAAFPDDRPWSAAEITDLLQSPGALLIGDAHCFLIGRCIADEAEILTLATHPDHRRKGLAKQALARFEAQIRQQAQSIFLEVDAANIAAKSLYSTSGFSQAGLRRGYYKHANRPATDAIILAKNLT